MPATREEQETILSYDCLLDEWHFYSNTPKHCRKWVAVVEVTKQVEEDGRLIEIEGTIQGNVIIQKKRVLTEGQRQATAERLRLAREEMN